MDAWVLYAILSAVFAGTHNFFFKMIAEKNYSTSLVSVYSYKIGVLIMAAYMLFNPHVFNISWNQLLLILIFSVGNTFFFFLSMLSRVVSMRNMDGVLFFPIYKTIGPILITLVSLFVYSEILTIEEAIGIIAGISVPLLLITKAETKIQKDLKKGVIFAVLTSLLTASSTVFAKELIENNLSIALYLFFSSTFGVILSYFFLRKEKIKNKKKYKKDGIIKFSVVAGFLHILSFFTFTSALEGNLAIVFTINSFSILIPIILSILIYNDDFTLRKTLVIGLSIISILLFI